MAFCEIYLGVVNKFGVYVGTVSWEKYLVCVGYGGGVSVWILRSDFLSCGVFVGISVL